MKILKKKHGVLQKNVNCIRECHISKGDRSTGECFIAVSSQITLLLSYSRGFASIKDRLYNDG